MDYIDSTSLALSGVKALQKQIKLVINECGFKLHQIAGKTCIKELNDREYLF